MRIAFLHIANNPHIIARAKFFLNAGHEVYCLSPPLNGGHDIPAGVELLILYPPKIIARFRILKVLANILMVRRMVRLHNIDILHVMWLGYAVYALFSKAKVQVFENMGSDVLVWPQQSFLWRIFIRFSYRFADAVIQDSEVAQIAGIKYGAPRKNNQIIEVGVDFSVFNQQIKKGIARQKLGLTPEQKFIFSPRSFTELYNIDTIITSIKKVKEEIPNAVFVFCKFFGDLESEYIEFIEQEGVQNDVIFAGFLDNELELPFYYRDSDVVISVPSSDSSPRTVYEAMACGSPVVVSELPWYHKKFVNKQDLLSVPIKNPEDLADAIIAILRKDITIDTKSASEKVYQKINATSENKKLEALYSSLLTS